LAQLKHIKEKEELAEKIRQDGLAESLLIVSVAKDEAAALVSKAGFEAERHYEEATTKAKEEAQEDYKKTIHSAMWECDMLSESAKKNHEDAVSLIIKKVMGKWRS